MGDSLTSRRKAFAVMGMKRVLVKAVSQMRCSALQSEQKEVSFLLSSETPSLDSLHEKQEVYLLHF